MEPSRQQLKDELQGGGFLSEIRNQYMPDSTEISKLAFEDYDDNSPTLTKEFVQRHASSILTELIKREREIYRDYEEETYRNAMVYFLKDYYQAGQSSMGKYSEAENSSGYSKYPELQRTLDKARSIFEDQKNFHEAFSGILPLIYPVDEVISESASQSRKRRAGIGLQNHIVRLIELCDFQVPRIEQTGNGELMTIEPNTNGADQREIYLASLTTLSDRYRQSLQDIPGGEEANQLPKFVATASGKRVITDSDQSDVTKKKIGQISGSGFRLVVFQDVKDKYIAEDAVISYESFLADMLPELLNQ